VLIVATELASNALKYGRPPTIVRLCRTGQDYIIDVVDHDPTTQPEHALRRQSASGGWALVLVRALALDVGWYVTTPPSTCGHASLHPQLTQCKPR
jgi:two-component sensor histidine kinase